MKATVVKLTKQYSRQLDKDIINIGKLNELFNDIYKALEPHVKRQSPFETSSLIWEIESDLTPIEFERVSYIWSLIRRKKGL